MIRVRAIGLLAICVLSSNLFASVREQGCTISISASVAYASLTAPAASSSSLYTINLTTGAASLIGTIGGGATIRAITVGPLSDRLYALTTVNNKVVTIGRTTPGAVLAAKMVTGLQSGETLFGISFRPLNGALYGLGSTSRLYTIDTGTGAATQVGSGPFTPALSGTEFGFDFNPTVDRIRVVSNAGQNLRLNPDTGAVAAVDVSLNGGATQAVGAAYTNSFVGAISTTLYDIDAVTDSLYIQNPPNGGTLVLVGSLGFDTSDLVGFDISNPQVLPLAQSGVTYSVTLSATGASPPYTYQVTSGSLPPGITLSTSGVLSGNTNITGGFPITITATDSLGCPGSQNFTFIVACAPVSVATSAAFASLTPPAGASSNFYEVDLSTGASRLVGAIGGAPLGSMAFIPDSEFVFGIKAGTNALVTFHRNTPGVVQTIGTISGISGNVVGLDFRPAAGQLYAVTDASRMYIIDPSTLTATPIGAVPFTPALSGTAFGVDFNPVVDRIRVVSNTGQNLRLNPDTGALTAIDPNLNGGATRAVGNAYSNNFFGATATTLYDIDAVSDSLYIQNPPNGGTLNLVGALGVDTNDSVGFDISSSVLPSATDGVAYSQTILGVGGLAPYNFSVTSGSLPSGMSLNSSTGLLSGTPTPPGSYSFTVTASDMNSCGGSQTYNFAVCPAVPVIATAQSVPVGGTGFASVVNHAGSTYLWTVTGGTITSGQGTTSIQFDAGSPGTRMIVSVVETNGNCSSSGMASAMVDFLDVPPSHLFHDFIIKLARNGVTAGCGGGNYCPNDSVLRSQMAVFLLRGEHGEAYAPPAAVGIFSDVPIPSFFADFIERLYNEGITGGCATNPLRYCPNSAVLRSQMAIFLLRAEHGSGYVPPTAVGIFQDVPVGSFAADFIEQLFNEGITGGCSTSPPLYCPNSATTRGAMAVFLVRTFNLQ